MSLKPTLAGLVLCLVVGVGRDAAACSCEVPPPPAGAFAEAHAVFRGKVVEVQDTNALARWELRPFHFVVRFKVRTAWKGASGPEFTLGTGEGGGDCGKSFEPGEEYVVYAYRNDRETAEHAKKGPVSWPDFNTHICTRTARVRDAREDLRFLKSKKPLPLGVSLPRAPPAGPKK